jgi:hypothetical protein
MKRQKSKRPLLTLGIGTALVLAACGGTTADSDTTTSTSAPAATTTTQPPTTTTTVVEMMAHYELVIDAAGFPALENGVHYEGWAIIDDAPVSTGKFNVAEGALVDLDGAAIEAFVVDEDLTHAAAIVISIEPSGDTDAVPADTHFVAGDVGAELTSVLAIDHPAALGTDFSDAAGQFILATPSNGDGTDEFSGVWFLDPSGPAASLVLPELPAGWTYEGWAVIDGTPVSTGLFLAAEGADSGEPFKGPDGTPPFPGEDFLQSAPEGVTFPTDLRELPIVISVEPVPDDAETPFALKPLVGMAPIDAVDHELYDLGLNNADLPTGIATIR